ncbi:disease resistance protein RGA5-like [Triticum urartu]|uniref:Disease resistance protein RPM1 n=1 Tax=Triticum urartu TaxID=4572 RepID=A0A8R7TQ79_TRIUA|nr:disease resistance protein RGA5-like [Triticum urartu]
MAAVVTGAMGTLLPKLANLITKEYNLHKGVKGEIMFLTAEMEHMQAALLKISEAPIDQPPDIQIKLWAKNVRDLSYDLEDNIDKFMVHIKTHGQPEKLHNFRDFIDKCLSLLTKGKIRHKIGIDIKDIKRRIEEVREQRDRYKVDSVAPAKPTCPTIDALRLSTLYKKATELVGIDEKSLEVVNMLKEGDEVSEKQLKVVSIVGFGGLGKTTLANAVYKKMKGQVDIQTQKPQFDCAAFISVSLNPNLKRIFKSLLHQLDKHTYQNINEASWGEEQLISEIRSFLENKRYLIVVDDIWDKSVWENIKFALIGNKYGSRVITTTRVLDVAQQAGGVYRLKALSVVDSRKLFYQRIYEMENKSPPNQLVKLSESILKRCGGVPLAILTIGSLLSSEKGRAHIYEYWSNVYKSISSGLGNGHDDVKNMRRILSVSYSGRPPHLKTCLLHLSMYPEDYEIEKEQLIWKWVGEGYLQKEQRKSLYDVGVDYLDELINKSLVQPVKFDHANKVRSCGLHDMVRDLIISLANEENFLTTIGGPQPGYLPSKIRRLSVQTSIDEVTNQLSTMSFSYVRSLTVSGPAFSLLPAVSGFPVLRVLDLTDCKQVDNGHWKDICNLFHLRYLSLKGTSITKIPKGIGNLQFLQVLDIRSTKIEEELPSIFNQLTQLLLVHMLNSIACVVPRWMCSLRFLFSLSITLKTLGEEDLQVLGSIPSLGELHIQVEKPTQGRDKRLVIGSSYPFLCLKRFIVKSGPMELRFAQGAMQRLQTIGLIFPDIQGTLLQFGDFVLGLENLSSLEHINVVCNYIFAIGKEVANVRTALEKECSMNPNKPILNFPPIFQEVIVTQVREAVEVSMRKALEKLCGGEPAAEEIGCKKVAVEA